MGSIAQRRPNRDTARPRTRRRASPVPRSPCAAAPGENARPPKQLTTPATDRRSPNRKGAAHTCQLWRAKNRTEEHPSAIGTNVMNASSQRESWEDATEEGRAKMGDLAPDQTQNHGGRIGWTNTKSRPPAAQAWTALRAA